jgi:murein DD-endopeptidase MepM/ murein hydrolase activator NlpD
MKFDVPKTDGNVRQLASQVDEQSGRANSMRPVTARLLGTLILLACGSIVLAQSMYKYQDADGTWIYTDRQPADQQQAEVLDLPAGEKDASVAVTTSLVGREVRFTAVNEFAAPVEIIIALDGLHNVELPMPDQAMRWVLAPHSSLILLELSAIEDNIAPQVDYRFIWLYGDPDSQHAPSQPYRAPFAVAGDYPITQAFPANTTHDTVDSRYAVDIAMPVGTDIHAARAGIVFEVASSNYRGGVDPEQDAQFANIIRILHDDGTHALYAHLNWNGIRVRPGDRVERGEYIAESGNTGFSSGPHLHFAVMQNLGMRLESLPIEFEAANGNSVTPTSGELIVAY